MRIVTWVLAPARPRLVCVAALQHRPSPPGLAKPGGNESLHGHSAEMDPQCEQSSFIMLAPIIAGLTDAHCKVGESRSYLLWRGTL
jgi:hypothetical protein